MLQLEATPRHLVRPRRVTTEASLGLRKVGVQRNATWSGIMSGAAILCVSDRHWAPRARRTILQKACILSNSENIESRSLFSVIEAHAHASAARTSGGPQE